MRLLLDAHLSPRRVGERLRALGHDVLALAGEDAIRSLTDAEVLELAAEQRRVVVTCDCSHFVVLARTLASREEHHAGIVLIWSRGNHQHREIVAGVDRFMREMPRQKTWIDRVVGL